MWRHPLIVLAALILAIGFVFDAALEIFLVRTQLYIYSQVIPFGSFAAGEWYQFPLIWESVARHPGDDRRGRPPLPGRHRPHPGREAGPAGPRLPQRARPSAPSW